jgi:hypothetical protein
MPLRDAAALGAVADMGCKGDGKPAISAPPPRPFPCTGTRAVSLHFFAWARNARETPALRERVVAACQLLLL